MSTRNPFGGKYFGARYECVDVESRLNMVRRFDARQCRAALKIEGLQTTVRRALERRLKHLAATGQPGKGGH